MKRNPVCPMGRKEMASIRGGGVWEDLKDWASSKIHEALAEIEGWIQKIEDAWSNPDPHFLIPPPASPYRPA